MNIDLHSYTYRQTASTLIISKTEGGKNTNTNLLLANTTC